MEERNKFIGGQGVAVDEHFAVLWSFSLSVLYYIWNESIQLQLAVKFFPYKPYFATSCSAIAKLLNATINLNWTVLHTARTWALNVDLRFHLVWLSDMNMSF